MTPEAGHLRGLAAENRLFTLCDIYIRDGHLPPDIEVSRASPEEDAEGVDALMRVGALGLFPLQVKATKQQVKKHRNRKNRKHIPCVVTGEETRSVKILRRLRKIIEECRAGTIKPMYM